MLALRLLTAAIGIPLLLLILWAGSPWLGVALAVVVLLGAVEIGELLVRAGYEVARGVIAALAVLAVALAAAIPTVGDWLLGAWLVVLLTASAAAALTEPTARPSFAAGWAPPVVR